MLFHHHEGDDAGNTPCTSLPSKTQTEGQSGSIKHIERPSICLGKEMSSTLPASLQKASADLRSLKSSAG